MMIAKQELIDHTSYRHSTPRLPSFYVDEPYLAVALG